MTDEFETLLLKGFAQLLDDEGLGTWREAGAYVDGETAIVLSAFPASPDDLITLETYVVAEDPTQNDDRIGLQIRTRRAGADPNPVRDLDSAIFRAIQSRHGYTLGNWPDGIRVRQGFRSSGTSLGQDDNGRWSRVSNYYLDVHRPSTYRL